MIKLSDYIAKRLKEHYQVKNVFMISGGGAMHLNDSIGKYLPYTCCHHEQACAIAAEGYARTNQELAVVNVTTGPGGLNCLNGVFGQWTDSAPVLYISGQVKHSTCKESCSIEGLRQLGDQEVDIISTVKHLTKYAKMVTEPNEIKYHLDKAIYEATTGRKGPVWLDIPINVQSAIIDENELVDFVPNIEKHTNAYDIKEIVQKLKNAQKPLVVAGHGIRLSGMQEEFLNFVEKTEIPVVTTFNGFDVIDDNHPCYVGRIGTIGQRAGNFNLQNADVVLFLGTRNNIRQVSYNWENFAKNAYKIVVDIDKAELEKPLVKPDMAVCADLKDFLPLLADSVEKLNTDNWLSFCKNLLAKYNFENTKEYQPSDKIGVNPYFFTHKLTELASENSIFVSANATPSICMFQTGCVKKGQRIIMNSGDASMGYDLPASIGAIVHSPDKNVICLAGDGSIMMNLQELQTIVFNKLPVKIFLYNNGEYASIRQTQCNFFNGNKTACSSDSGVGMPNFEALANAFGLTVFKVNTNENVEDTIKKVLSSNGPCFCNVILEKDYIFTPKLSSKKLDDGTMVSSSLEDMYPFLPRDEFEKNII